MKIKIKNYIPQIIIFLFVIILFNIANVLGINMPTIISESLSKFAMNGIFVLAMIPMINAGVGMNFGLPIGIVAGLIGMLIGIQFHFTGLWGLIAVILIGLPVAIIFGWIYAGILNHAKGKEDIASMFIGYSFIPIMSFFWAIAPFTNREMLFPIGGTGLRPRISLENYFGNVLERYATWKIGGFTIPVGLLLCYGIVAMSLFLFFRSHYGKVMMAVGENEEYCKRIGIPIMKMRTWAIILSTVLGAIGICVYAQTYGFIELYEAPQSFAFPAVSCILIGGAVARKAGIWNAILGTYMYQTIFLLSTPIANELMISQMAEIMRMLITNGIILYAFLKREKRGGV